MKALACLAVLGFALSACSYTRETVVQKPAPATTTTYVQPDAASPTGVSTTTVYRQ